MPKLYGRVESNNSISARGSHNTFHDDEISGYLQLFAVMVVPDYDPSTGASNLDYLEIVVEDRPILFPMKCDKEHNMCPFFTLSGFPLRKEEQLFFVPDVKIEKGKEFAIRFRASDSDVTRTYYVRPFGLLYTADEIRDRFGIEPEDWEKQEGGLSQEGEKVMPWIKYGFNQEATQLGRWYEVEDVSERVHADTELTLLAIGCVPHPNQSDLRVADLHDNAVAFEYPLKTEGLQTGAHINECPVGKAEDLRPPFFLPEPIRPTFSDDYMRIQIRDNGSSQIPANGSFVWVKCVQRISG